MHRRRLLLLGMGIGAFGGSLPLYQGRSDEAAPGFGTEIGFELVDGDGRTVSALDFRGRWVLVFFGYTYCPDLCPTTLNEIAEALAQLGPPATRVKPIFVSIDPQRDTPQALREYVKAFDERILALTGTGEQLERAARAFGVTFFKIPSPNYNEYTFAHSAFTTLVGPEGGLVTRFSADEPSAGIATALRALINDGGA